MGLPWIRIDTNIPSHDKILDLLDDEGVRSSTLKWQAVASYLFSIAWSGGHGTNGRIPPTALAYVHGTKATARLLQKHHLWDEAARGWQIHNYEKYQQLAETSDLIRETKTVSGKQGACQRWHLRGCWDDVKGCRGWKR